MRPRLRTVTLAGVVAVGGLLVLGTSDARAQLFINTPGFSMGVGAPYAGVYPAYRYAPVVPVAPVVPAVAVAPVYPAYPVVRSYVYGPRPYVYRHHGYYRPYRRW